jgi:hypothetical protein
MQYDLRLSLAATASRMVGGDTGGILAIIAFVWNILGGLGDFCGSE